MGEDDCGPSGDAEEWLGRFRHAGRRIGAAAAAMPPARRREPQGRGAGGDITVLIDRVAEDIVLETLSGLGVDILSEEMGLREDGGDLLVVVDPIDGSLNAKRGLPGYSTSIALADGPTFADLRLGWVLDHGTGEEWVAERDRGVWLSGAALVPDAPGPGRMLDLVAIEGAKPARVARAAPVMEGRVNRLRAIGSAALSLCHAAGGRVDAMIALGRVRAVDVAAAVLIAHEAGVLVGLPDPEDLRGARLDLDSRWNALAARDEEAFAIARAALTAAASGDS